LLLQGAIHEFKPNLSKEKEELRAFGIKKELYRPFQEILSALSLLHGLKEKSTFGRVDELHKKQLFSMKGAANIKRAISQVLTLRIEAHLFYQDENEFLFHRGPDLNEKNQEARLLYLDPPRLKLLEVSGA
jgi:signal-transduction protein with cAMP-binding, CBS, and nucleotidyltransferase domain